MKRVLLIAAMIMVGALLFGEIEYDSGFNYRTKEGTHNYTVVKQKTFKKPLAYKYVLSPPTETSAGELLFEHDVKKINGKTTYILNSFNRNLDRVSMGSNGVWLWTKNGKYLRNRVFGYERLSNNQRKRALLKDVIYKYSNNTYKPINYIKPKQEITEITNNGYFKITDLYDDLGPYWQGVQKFNMDKAIIFNFEYDADKPNYSIERRLEYVDDSKIVFSFFSYYASEESMHEILDARAGIIIYNHDRTLRRKIDLPFRGLGEVYSSPDGSVFALVEGDPHGIINDKNSALLYEDGRIVTSESIGCSLSPDFWSADGSLMTTNCGDLIDVMKGKKLMSIKEAGPPSNASAGRILVTYKHMIKVFDIKTKEMIASFSIGSGALGYNFSISGDGTEVLTVTDMKYTKIKIGERKK